MDLSDSVNLYLFINNYQPTFIVFVWELLDTLHFEYKQVDFLITFRIFLGVAMWIKSIPHDLVQLKFNSQWGMFLDVLQNRMASHKVRCELNMIEASQPVLKTKYCVSNKKKHQPFCRQRCVYCNYTITVTHFIRT